VSGNSSIGHCLELDSDGETLGYVALIPSKRIKSYQRKDGVNLLKANNYHKMAGYFNLLLESHPEIKEKIEQLYFNKSKRAVTDPVFKIKHLHKHFLDACRAAGIKPNEYPFNTYYLAYKALCRYVKQLEAQNMYQASKRHGEDAARRARSTGIGNKNSPEILQPFQSVQFDGHLLDSMITLTFLTLEGDEVTKEINRLWLLVIIDVATKLILGYHLCLGEYSSEDVLFCIRNAVMPKELMNFTIPGLKYPEQIGFHSIAIPQTERALWNEFYYDNAKANLSEIVRQKLTEEIGCEINAGPVKMPERRNLIERFFRTLEENGFHRLPNTTGSNLSDPKRKNPEKEAIKYKISLEHLEQVTELLIAQYNTTPNEGISNISPLECMQQRINRGYLPRIMPIEKCNDFTFLALHSQRTVHGNIKKGTRPYIYYEGVIYRNDMLSNSPDIIGAKLDLLININDLRLIKAYLPDGSDFGILTAKGKWGITPHNLKMRKQINKLKNDKRIHYTSQDDPVIIVQRHFEEVALNQKTKRSQLAKLNQYKAKMSVSEEKNDSRENNVKVQQDETTPAFPTNVEEKTQKDNKNNNRKTIIY